MVRAFFDIFRQRTLIGTFAKRNLKTRFMASVLGWFWIVATPILLLCVYTFVFGYIFKPEWAILEEKNVEYVLFLFAGLTVYWIFAEMVNTAPGAIRSQATLVKKVKFPIHILPVVLNVGAMFNFLVNFTLLLAAMLVLGQTFSWTALLLPVVLMPAILFTLGVGWLLTATGTYFRDVAQAAGVISLIFLFLSAIFFPSQALPETVQTALMFNPIAVSIEGVRSIMLYNEMPDWTAMGVGAGVGVVFIILGLGLFQKVRAGFAGVL